MSEEESSASGEDRSQIIAHFQEITGVEDEGRTVELLSSHNWDLEAAVQDTLNEREGLHPLYGPQTTPPAPPNNTTTPQVPQPVRHPRHPRAVVPRVQGWWEWMVSLAFFPLRFVINTTSELLQFLVSLVFGWQPLPARNPRADVMQFISELEANYGTTHPAFLPCSYSDALTRARQELRFLLVYLHSPGHQDTPLFCRTVLAVQEFVNFTERSCLCWGVGVNTEEGVRVSYVLRENTYPFLALIVLKQSRMVMCERVEGCVERGELIGRLQRAIRENEAELVAERSERARRDVDKRLREEQDAAYHASLRADQEKERRRREEESRVEEEREREREREREQRRKEEEFTLEQERRVLRLPPEPDPSDPQALHVMLRMPGGETIVRRFNTTDKLESVYDFAYTDDQLPQRFTLVSNFPRQELVCEGEGGPQLGELGLGRRCVLFIHDVTEED